MNYYNEFDPYAAEWLRNLIDAGHIPAGDVDERSITEVQPDDLDGYTQCHFFAGISGWPLALRLAGWPDDAPVWTGSCPCQPFSAAGKGEGTKDERHLWPEMFRLIKDCRPPAIFGEQVASAEVVGTQLEAAFTLAVQGGDYAKANKLAKRLVRTKSFSWTPRWLDGISADLEAAGYTVRPDVLGAHSVGSPHIRQRLFWLAESDSTQFRGQPSAGKQPVHEQGCLTHRLGHTISTGPQGQSGDGVPGHEPGWQRAEAAGPAATASDAPDGMAKPDGPELRGQSSAGKQPVHEQGGWSDFRIIHCKDGKARRISSQSGDEPLAYGIPRDVGRVLAGVEGVDTTAIRHARRNRTGRLKGYGNAVCPELTAQFILAYMEIASK